MKLTKEQLKKLVTEAVATTLNEGDILAIGGLDLQNLGASVYEILDRVQEERLWWSDAGDEIQQLLRDAYELGRSYDGKL